MRSALANPLRLWPALALIAAVLGLTRGCLPRGTYTCSSDENCVRPPAEGQCIDEFCAYPDDSCEPIPLRYDDLAGGGLANTCVGGGATETDISSGGSTTPSEDTSMTGSSSGGDTDCDAPTCVDYDGDGHCADEAAEEPDCDDTNPFRFEGCHYLSPAGDDGASGTAPDQAWLTFEQAVMRLQPGDSLVLVDGKYGAESSGILDVTCGIGGAAIGTAQAPISITAQHERQARIVANGVQPAIRLNGCSYWNISGLHARSTDAVHDAAKMADGTFVVRIIGSDHILLRRLLLTHPNRYIRSALLRMESTIDSLVEDSEAYFYNHDALQLSACTNVTVRRVYANSKGHPDLEGCESSPKVPTVPQCSANPAAGGTGFVLGGDALTVENCASRLNASSGFEINATQSRLLGSLSVQDGTGVTVYWLADGTMENVVVARPSGYGVNVSSTVGVAQATLRNITVVRSEGVGFRNYAGETPCMESGGNCGTLALNVAALRGMGTGIATSNALGDGTANQWTVRRSAVFGNNPDFTPDEPFDDGAGIVRSSIVEDPTDVGIDQGQCAVYIPSGSILSGAGQDGADIGATMLYRYADGELTDEPLWDPVTSEFPCGAIVEGINDDMFESCTGINQWFNAGVGGCDLPTASEDPCR